MTTRVSATHRLHLFVLELLQLAFDGGDLLLQSLKLLRIVHLLLCPGELLAQVLQSLTQGLLFLLLLRVHGGVLRVYVCTREGDRSMFSVRAILANGPFWPKNGPVPVASSGLGVSMHRFDQRRCFLLVVDPPIELGAAHFVE